jgi:hypothetical protein
MGLIKPPFVPPYFRDPVTQQIMHDPVYLGPDTFDRSTIKNPVGLSRQYWNPLDKHRYTHMYSNTPLSEAIEAWKLRTGYFHSSLGVQYPDPDSDTGPSDDVDEYLDNEIGEREESEQASAREIAAEAAAIADFPM